MIIIQCISAEMIEDIKNMPMFRYTFQGKETPKLIVLVHEPSGVQTAYIAGKTYSLGIA